MERFRLAIITILATLTCVFLLSSCGAEKDALKGTWIGKNNDDVSVTWVFDGKGECNMENEFGINLDGTYTIISNDVKINLAAWEEELEYSFKVDGNHLSLIPAEAFRPNYELQKK